MAESVRAFRIRDIADRAGVSAATVSRVLNNAASVRPDKREKVVAVINELGYRPSRMAANMRRQQVQMIGVVVSDIENPHFTQMVRAVEDAAHVRGYGVLLCNSDEDLAKQRDYLGILIAERVAGAIISPTAADAPEISELIDHGAAVVAFDRAVADRRADAVLAANVGGAALGTEHLIAGGHERIGFVGGPSGIETADERLLGYERAMSAGGLRPRVVLGDFQVEGGRRAATELLEGGATALLVANNLMAIGVLQAVRAASLRPPGNVGVVSIDDPPWAELTDPPLTTLAQPVRAMAEAAVELLFRRLQGGHKRHQRRFFEFELQHRYSCCVEQGRTRRPALRAGLGL